jgi:putative ABC transport system permease protein
LEVIERKLHNERLLSFVSAAFAIQVLALAGAGLFGLVWFSAAGRERELGVRTALGARPADLTRLLLERAGWLFVLGITIGAGESMAMTKANRGLLFGVSGCDAGAFLAAASMLSLIGLTAASIPAWRSARADPLKTLRAE